LYDVVIPSSSCHTNPWQLTCASLPMAGGWNTSLDELRRGEQWGSARGGVGSHSGKRRAPLEEGNQQPNDQHRTDHLGHAGERTVCQGGRRRVIRRLVGERSYN